MIKGMAAAGRRLDRPEWVDSAQCALRYLIDHHWRDGRLLASSRDGRAQLNGYLDDHAYLIDAILELLQARWDNGHLSFAIQLAERLLTHFEDPAHGGFFFTSDDHEALVHRPKPLGDDATPSGNGVAVEALTALTALTGEPRFAAAAERTLRCAWHAIERAPHAHVGLLEGLQHYLEPPEQLVIRGHGSELEAWRRHAGAGYDPGRSVYAIPLAATGLPVALQDKTGSADRTIAYRCRGTSCGPPVTQLAELC
jgi:uncharacterized protein YyaL (SSP411 family)